MGPSCTFFQNRASPSPHLCIVYFWLHFEHLHSSMNLSGLLLCFYSVLVIMFLTFFLINLKIIPLLLIEFLCEQNTRASKPGVLFLLARYFLVCCLVGCVHYMDWLFFLLVLYCIYLIGSIEHQLWGNFVI